MNDAAKFARTAAWVRVYRHEITRRQRIANEKPKAYRKVFGANLKPLDTESCTDSKHVWIPATTLWIHDGGAGSTKIQGFARRGLREAMPYKWHNFQVTPQICWNCAETRELLTQILSREEKLTLAARIQKERQGKPRGKKGSGLVLTDIEMFFDDAEALV